MVQEPTRGADLPLDVSHRDRTGTSRASRIRRASTLVGSRTLARFGVHVRGLRFCLIVALATVGATVRAAVPVEESQASPRNVERAAPQAIDNTPERDEGDGGIGALYYQLQVLQDDVRRLQGLVEEQHHRIERLTAEQRERYIELDQRLLDISRSSSGVGEGVPDATAFKPGTGGSEREVYDAAFALVKNAAGLVPSERLAAYQEATARFEALIANFPNGEFVANAFYWIGEIRLSTDELELARQAFAQVVNLYGDHAKVPDALYKLGVVYHRLGENDRALQYFDRVIGEHGEHTASGLARSYAAELR